MAVSRIRIAKDKAELVRSLTEIEGKTGPFQTYADVIAFAALLGKRRLKRIPVDGLSKRDPGPISLEVFISRGYDGIIKLVAIAETENIKLLSPFDLEAEEERALIFEEYANGGLEVLQDECRGTVDYSDRLLLILMAERDRSSVPEGEFDLSRFLG
ncbi:MAG: DNA phosphorothioation-associated protein 4 [Planktothrix sp.]